MQYATKVVDKNRFNPVKDQQLIEKQERDDIKCKLIQIAISFKGRLCNSRIKDENDRSRKKQ